jgi:anti-anti-sigma regulatory factor
MFRITVYNEAPAIRLMLEGYLTGPYVEELQRCWQAHSLQPCSVVVDLTEVAFMDSSGKALLAQMYRQGAYLVGSGVMTTALIEEIRLTVRHVSHRAPPRTSQILKKEIEDESDKRGHPRFKDDL